MDDVTFKANFVAATDELFTLFKKECELPRTNWNKHVNIEQNDSIATIVLSTDLNWENTLHCFPITLNEASPCHIWGFEIFLKEANLLDCLDTILDLLNKPSWDDIFLNTQSKLFVILTRSVIREIDPRNDIIKFEWKMFGQCKIVTFVFKDRGRSGLMNLW